LIQKAAFLIKFLIMV